MIKKFDSTVFNHSTILNYIMYISSPTLIVTVVHYINYFTYYLAYFKNQMIFDQKTNILFLQYMYYKIR